MKTEIHPKYVDCAATCACGASFSTRSTKDAISVETCSECHPFYTGKEKLLDTTGRVERFRRKYSGVKATEKKKPVAEQLADQAKDKDKKRVLLGQPTGKKQEKQPVAKPAEKADTAPAAAKAEAKPTEAAAPPAAKAEVKPAEKAESVGSVEKAEAKPAAAESDAAKTEN